MNQIRYWTERRFVREPDAIASKLGWNEKADKWAEFVRVCGPHYVEPVLERLSELTRERVTLTRLIDVGCGEGSLLRKLAKDVPGYCTLWGIDKAHRLIEMAKFLTHEPRIRYAVEDVEGALGEVKARTQGPPSKGEIAIRERLADKYEGDFDVVLCIQTLTSIANIRAAFRWAEAALKPGGILLATVTHPMRVYAELIESGESLPPYQQSFPYVLRLSWQVCGINGSLEVLNYHHATAEYIAAARECNLTVLDVREVGHKKTLPLGVVPEYMMFTAVKRRV
ncbi:MAG: methyltransferase domain-containing protein [bacterium]|nr:methyltransferase domain-containing protein [bacterium]